MHHTAWKLVLTGFACLFLASAAKAGAIRFASDKVAAAAASGASTAETGLTAAARASRGALRRSGAVVKTGAVSLGKGMKATPGLVADGTKVVARTAWKIIW